MEYFGDYAVVTSSNGDKRSNQRSRSKIRAYLYGASRNASPSPSSDDEDDRRNSLASAARGAKKRLSRTGSSIMQLSSAKASTNYLSCGSSSNLGTPSDPEEAERIADQIKEKAFLDSIAAQNHVPTSSDDNSNDEIVIAPVRRKSLFTPGIATRNPSDILRKPPPPRSLETQADRDYYYNPAYPESSPLAALAALNFNSDGRSTPNSFTHLGGLQLGTLRVTNGASSPTRNMRPEELHRPWTADSEDFHTASEGSVADGQMTPTNARRSMSMSSVRTLSLSDKPALQSRKPSSRTDDAAAMANEYMSELGGSPFSPGNDWPTSTETPKGDIHEDEGVFVGSQSPARPQSWKNSIEDVPAQETGITQQDAFNKLNGVGQPAEVQAASYVQELNERGRPPLVTAPGSDSGYSSSTSVIVVDKTKISAEQKPSSESKNRRFFLRPRSTTRPRPNAQSKSENDVPRSRLRSRTPRPSDFKAIPFDSLPEVESPKLPQTDPAMMDRGRVSERPKESNKRLQKTRTKSQPPPPKPIAVQGYTHLDQYHIPRVPSLIATRHAERLENFPLLDHTFPSSNHTNLNQRSPTLDFRTIPIRFPSPANALEAAAVGLSTSSMSKEDLLESYIQPSMAEVLSNHDQPATAGLDQTDLGAGKGKKLQKRIMKEQKAAEKRLAKEEKELEKRLSRDRRQMDKRKSLNGSRERSRSRPASWIRGRSRERRSEDLGNEATIADFGTVAESIGRGPYDIARAVQVSRSRSREKPSQNECLPSSRMPNSSEPRGSSGDMVTGNRDFDEEALHRGKEETRPQFKTAPSSLSPNAYSPDIFSSTADQHENRRPRPDLSAFQGTESRGLPLNDRRRSGRFVRPRSMVADAPPVPALPSRDQVNQREQEWARSRPQSMVVDHQAPEEIIEENKRCSTAVSQSQPSNAANEAVDKSAEIDLWEASRRAWRKRRQSAGEALFQQYTADSEENVNQQRRKSIKDTLTDHPETNLRSTGCPHCQSSTTPQQNEVKPPVLPTPAERRAQPPPLRLPRKRVPSAGLASPSTPAFKSTVERLSGRFDGGLSYGYEPGFGLGGSAGTRSTSTEASRKSIAVSRGFGLDLSDLPVFVAPAPAPVERVR